jgi:hypothetical protein
MRWLRGYAAAVVATAVCLLLIATPAPAAITPKWARTLVKEAPEPPEGIGRYSQRVLFEETREEVKGDGSVKVTYRSASQALMSRAADVGIGSFYFNETRRMIANKAWHIAPGKGAKRNRRPPVDIAVGAEFLSDSKVRAIGVTGIKKGSIVLFEFAAIEEPYTMPRAYTFSSRFPALVQRYVIELPKGWSLQWDWLRLEGPDPVVEDNVYTWVLTDREAAEEDSLGPSIFEQSPTLTLNVLPPEGAKVKPAVLESWRAFSLWYEQVAGDRHAAGEEIERAASEVMAAAGEEIFPAIGAAGRYVRDKVRYVAVELGVGAFRPRPAEETLAKLYGDCKDKGTLFRSVLATKEVDSHPVLVNLSERGTVSETIPAWGFDHYVVAVPLHADQPAPDAFAAAVLDAGDLGRFLIVDTTDEKTSIGYVSGSLSGKRALLVAGDRGRLVTLPGLDPAAHRIDRKLTSELTPMGALTFRRESSYYGAFAARARWSYSASATERRKGVEGRIMDFWPSARVEEYDAVPEAGDGAFVETVTSRVHLKAGSDGMRRLAIFPGAREELPRVSLGKREVPVDYGYPRTIRYEVEFNGLPDEVSGPDPREDAGEGWSVKTAINADSGRLAATWELVLEKTRFDPDEFESLRGLWTAISRASSASLKIPR